MNHVGIESFIVETLEVKEPSRTKGPPRHKPGEKFLLGPVPWNWCTAAGRLPGKSLQVATAIWFLAGMEGSDTIRLQRKVLEELGVKRKATYRALKALETAGLIACTQRTGRRAVIKILEVPTTTGNGKESSMKGVS